MRTFTVLLLVPNFRILFVSYTESTPVQNLSNTSAERKAVTYYNACMDKETIERLGTKPLTDLLSQLFDDNWMTWNFQRTMELTHGLNPPMPFFIVSVFDDDKQPTMNILQVISLVEHCQTVSPYYYLRQGERNEHWRRLRDWSFLPYVCVYTMTYHLHMSYKIGSNGSALL